MADENISFEQLREWRDEASEQFMETGFMDPEYQQIAIRIAAQSMGEKMGGQAVPMPALIGAFACQAFITGYMAAKGLSIEAAQEILNESADLAKKELDQDKRDFIKKHREGKLRLEDQPHSE